MRIKIITIFFILILLSFICYAQSSEVEVKDKKGSWYLVVNGKPFYIKGAGCGLAKGKSGEDYLKLAKELGANAVRTWGTDQGTKEYLDNAHRYGLMVCAGIWLDWVDERNYLSYVHDDEYKKQKRKEVLDYVMNSKTTLPYFSGVSAMRQYTGRKILEKRLRLPNF